MDLKATRELAGCSFGRTPGAGVRESLCCREQEDPVGPGASFSNLVARARERRQMSSDPAL